MTLIRSMNYNAYKQIDSRTKLARKALANCSLCPRNCGVDRTAGDKGYCGLDDTIRCFREVVNQGEETQLAPSHQVHFTGCNLKCEFCMVSEWNEQPLLSDKMDFALTAKVIASRRSQGAKTVNLLGGEPSVNLYGILELLGLLDPELTVVWNSNMYYNNVVEELMDGLVDVYLADLKCGSKTCAANILDAEDYVEVAQKNILNAAQNADIIVRHVIMPGHSKCCLEPILEWLASRIPDVKLSLKGDYVPPADANYAPKEYLKQEHVQNAVKLAKSMDIKLVQ